MLRSGARQRRRATRLHPAEILTILILFQHSGYRTFKGFYTQHVQVHLRQEFPGLLSYSALRGPDAALPCAPSHLPAHAVGGVFGDQLHRLHLAQLSAIPRASRSTGSLRVDARRGKTSVGWFYGFKLHLVVNDRGELLALCLTPGNTDDRRPVPRLVRRLFGRLFGDKGYISAPLAERLLVTQGLRLITKLRKNMRNQLLHLSDRLLLRKRALIETIVDQLKNVCQIEHSRHRSPFNFLVHLLAGLAPIATSPRSPRCTSLPIHSSPTLSKTDVE